MKSQSVFQGLEASQKAQLQKLQEQLDSLIGLQSVKKVIGEIQAFALIQKYRELRRQGKIADMGRNQDVAARETELYHSAKEVISAIETLVKNPYSAEGFYKIFAAGFLPVPYLWNETDEFRHAKNWRTKPVKGGVRVVDKNGKALKANQLIEIAKSNLADAEYNLKHRMTKNQLSVN